MKKLIIALILIPSIAVAEFLPDGCYVAHYYRSDPCWYSLTSVYQWNEQLALQNNYGNAVSNIALKSFDEERLKNSCLNDLAVADAENVLCVSDYNDLVNDYSALSASESALRQSLNKANAYAKKLKKACGVKCKKIKAPVL